MPIIGRQIEREPTIHNQQSDAESFVFFSLCTGDTAAVVVVAIVSSSSFQRKSSARLVQNEHAYKDWKMCMCL